MHINKILKNIYFFIRYIKTFFLEGTFFVRFIPTDKCNLSCRYCWQNKRKSELMTKKYFDKYLGHAIKMNVGVVDFSGGEPMLWPHLFYAIKKCSKHHIKTHLTTNGTLLNKETIEELGKSGLDYLNISVDTFEDNPISSKSILKKEDILKALLSAKIKYKINIRVNSVIYKNNFLQTKEIIEYLNKKGIPLSLGFAIFMSNNSFDFNEEIFYSEKDKTELREIADYIISCKEKGYKIIDPYSYFENVFKFIQKESFWKCNYPTKFGWINISPSGKIRSCTKKMDELEINFLRLDKNNIKWPRSLYRKKTNECNRFCYSNCAYDSWYYSKHKIKMLFNLFYY